ncbi:MAG: hypothetical protein PHX72_00690 [Candidatus Shapirobacteria bacterium]|nr:hypothetical protein [Candidatus Shapirobacteria bacterium]
MPKRKIPLETGHIYHVYFHAIDKLKIFNHSKNKKLFINIINYYQNQNTPVSFSNLNKNYSLPERLLVMKKLTEEKSFLVKIISFCCVSAHCHFTLEQIIDNGISLFMKQVLSSFAHIYNHQNNRQGSLYRSRFSSRLVKNDNDLIHLTAYHHLHPYTNGLVDKYEEIFYYPFCSLPAYFGKKAPIRVNPERVFEIIPPEEYQKYLSNRAQHQKELEKYKREETSY